MEVFLPTLRALPDLLLASSVHVVSESSSSLSRSVCLVEHVCSMSYISQSNILRLISYRCTNNHWRIAPWSKTPVDR